MFFTLSLILTDTSLQAVAPPWFAAAIAVAIDPIRHQLNRMDTNIAKVCWPSLLRWLVWLAYF